MKNPIRVAWDNSLARRNLTGTGVYAARLLEHLAKEPDLALESFTGWPNTTRGGGILRRTFQVAGSMAWVHLDLPTRLWMGGFDLLHAPAFIAPIASPCPVVITIHDITYLLYPSHFSNWWIRYMKSVVPITVKSAAAIICGSEHSKRDIVNAYALPDSKVHVVPYGVDHQRFHPAAVLDCSWARQLGICKGYVLHVGELSQRKNIPTLLRAVAYLRARGKWGDRQLVLAGTESPGMRGADEIHESILQLDLSTSVILAGRVPDENLPGLYATASLLVMPSLYEGFGFPVLESMAAGTPVVASNISSLPEVAGEAAILVSPHEVEELANAIADVLFNPGFAADLRSKGLARAQQFNWHRTAAETTQVYRSVVGQR
ncbi:MAG: glycosyl transferase group 1 [Candidatus Angelobacter sp.]|jgi:glycosyltransferase involved in cell wall biosynthesis|nr:glycosyl transferase group 1 [Candidatus Angelobacter sp.]